MAAAMPATAVTTVKKIFRIIENMIVRWAKGFLPIASIPLGIALEKVKNPMVKEIKTTTMAVI